MPHHKPIIQYSHGQYQFKVPFIMYADFESILEPIQGPATDPRASSTRGVNIHMLSGWGVYSKFANDEVNDPIKEYRAVDCVSQFCKHIISEARCLYSSFPEKPMEPLTKAQLKEYAKANKCHICFSPFKPKDRKVRDHCHYTGIYRGAANSTCNLKYRIPSYIPLVFHNLAGYDAHMFIREFAKHRSCMGIIAKNTEDYISFSIKIEVGQYIGKDELERPVEIDLRFIDSIKFMSSSLDSLVNNLTKGGGISLGLRNIASNNANP